MTTQGNRRPARRPIKMDVPLTTGEMNDLRLALAIAEVDLAMDGNTATADRIEKLDARLRACQMELSLAEAYVTGLDDDSYQALCETLDEGIPTCPTKWQ